MPSSLLFFPIMPFLNGKMQGQGSKAGLLSSRSIAETSRFVLPESYADPAVRRRRGRGHFQGCGRSAKYDTGRRPESPQQAKLWQVRKGFGTWAAPCSIRRGVASSAFFRHPSPLPHLPYPLAFVLSLAVGNQPLLWCPSRHWPTCRCNSLSVVRGRTLPEVTESRR